MSSSLEAVEYRWLIDRVRDLRKANGITQAELADRLDTVQSYVAKTEGYERRLDILEFIAYCEAIGLQASQVIAEFETRSQS